ncbi:MAG: ABC transporter ATP-binding protein [Spirochaetaceae bacterium]|nr:ABC transporter ATP-binding protein [Spirochaetaceae bacterium]
MDKPIIQVTDISAHYATKPILEKISFSMYENTLTCILGKNGAGKSTLLSILSKTYNHHLTITNDDAIFIKDKPLKDFLNKEFSTILSFIPQNEQPIWNYSVYEIVAMGRYPYHNFYFSLTNTDKQIISHALKLLELEKLQDKFIYEISGGELQRVYLARTLCQETSIILLDEPFSHIDIYYQHILCDFLKKQCQNNKTVIMTIHDINLAAQYSDYILLLKDGKILDFGKTEKVFSEANLSHCFDCKIKITENPITQKKEGTIVV